MHPGPSTLMVIVLFLSLFSADTYAASIVVF
jgi:hypothetical protein